MNRTPRLLIIDDSSYICAQIKQIFKNEENIELASANNGQEALHCIRTFMPDMILLDVILPDIEGYELYHKIKEIDQNNTSIIFLTSKDQDSDIVKGFSLGACDYIKKPFHNEVLKSRVLVHLHDKQLKDELRKMNEQMEASMRKLNSLAYRDPLTGLYNRRYVEEQLQDQIIHGQTQTALMMCDVDDFKHINDYYGHEVGDVVLIGIANIIESADSSLHAIRWGGEEFLIILSGKNKEEVFQTSEQIRKSIERFSFSSKQTPFHCTISIGLTMYDNSYTFKQNLEKADEALYIGKRSGKNCVIWSDGIYR